jgi:hypothetical protein
MFLSWKSSNSKAIGQVGATACGQEALEGQLTILDSEEQAQVNLHDNAAARLANAAAFAGLAALRLRHGLDDRGDAGGGGVHVDCRQAVSINYVENEI